MWLVRKPWNCCWKAQQSPGPKVSWQRGTAGKPPQILAARDTPDTRDCGLWDTPATWDLGDSASGKRLFTFIPCLQLSDFKINSSVGFSLLCVFPFDQADVFRDGVGIFPGTRFDDFQAIFSAPAMSCAWLCSLLRR